MGQRRVGAVRPIESRWDDFKLNGRDFRRDERHRGGRQRRRARQHAQGAWMSGAAGYGLLVLILAGVKVACDDERQQLVQFGCSHKHGKPHRSCAQVSAINAIHSITPCESVLHGSMYTEPAIVSRACAVSGHPPEIGGLFC